MTVGRSLSFRLTGATGPTSPLSPMTEFHSHSARTPVDPAIAGPASGPIAIIVPTNGSRPSWPDLLVLRRALDRADRVLAEIRAVERRLTLARRT